jgi:hypothetical protein
LFRPFFQITWPWARNVKVNPHMPTRLGHSSNLSVQRQKKEEHTSRDSKEKILAVLLFLVGSIPKRKTKTNGSGTVFLIFLERERESRVIIIIITVITGAHWSFVPPLCLRWRRNKRRRRRCCCCALLWLCFTIRGDNERNQNCSESNSLLSLSLCVCTESFFFLPFYLYLKEKESRLRSKCVSSKAHTEVSTITRCAF